MRKWMIVGTMLAVALDVPEPVDALNTERIERKIAMEQESHPVVYWTRRDESMPARQANVSEKKSHVERMMKLAARRSA